MKEKATDIISCLLTSMGMTQAQSKLLFYLSLVSTFLGLAISFTRYIILPLINKAQSKSLTSADALDAVEKTKDFIDDLVDDGKINDSNKK